MPDIADLAADREQQLRDDALAAHHRSQRLARASRPTADWPGLLEDPDAPAPCALCGEPIPPARVAAVPDTQTCIDCARELERGLVRAAGRTGPT
jgi:hypothetical protein